MILQALLLSDHCDVGIGARKGLLRLGVAASTAPREGLSQVTREANATETVSARLVWFGWWLMVVGGGEMAFFFWHCMAKDDP